MDPGKRTAAASAAGVQGRALIASRQPRRCSFFVLLSLPAGQCLPALLSAGPAVPGEGLACYPPPQHGRSSPSTAEGEDGRDLSGSPVALQTNSARKALVPRRRRAVGAEPLFEGWVLVEWEGGFPSWHLMVALLAHTRQGPASSAAFWARASEGRAAGWTASPLSSRQPCGFPGRSPPLSFVEVSGLPQWQERTVAGQLTGEGVETRTGAGMEQLGSRG